MNKLAPIVIFTYNRPLHLNRCLESLSNCRLFKDSEKYIYCDGLKKTDNKKTLNEISKTISKYADDKTKVIRRKYNLGLSNSIINGLNEIFLFHNSAIIVEDDLVFSKYFLIYMNKSLKLYLNENRVCSISAYTIPTKTNLSDFFFLKFINSWGWATWRRAWNKFNPDSLYLLKKLTSHRYSFNLDFSYPYMKMLNDNYQKKNDSWAIKWYASIFIEDMITLYSKYNLVNNIGMDEFASNTKQKIYQSDLVNTEFKIKKIEVKEDKKARLIYANYHKALVIKLIFLKIFSYLKK